MIEGIREDGGNAFFEKKSTAVDRAKTELRTGRKRSILIMRYDAPTYRGYEQWRMVGGEPTKVRGD
ncbi:MAG: hypothetical protein WC932_02270 [archaeon]|jgi:hypothetical protein